MTSLGFKITGAITIVFLVILIALSCWMYGCAVSDKDNRVQLLKRVFGTSIILSSIAVVFVVNALPELI